MGRKKSVHNKTKTDKVTTCPWCADFNNPDPLHHPGGQVRHEVYQLQNNPMVYRMAECMLFAINNMKNHIVIEPDTNRVEGWHSWFTRTLRSAGFDLVDSVESRDEPG